ncbi:DNA mismatch repair protein MutS [Niabella beijingensis]|uniref:DNA mismatch repair protein MutS n=1 Tax=Niabella beijingensis TaxID=2872700 RepID=UPI001CBC657A|nr:DNA mismatch repair protein MutS [Niabella beijingensis]MBZ4187875.1 DNA mismatch repair protein MutS [Niabella beijingensis]
MAKAKNNNPQDTPLMQQHRAIKQKYPDAVLLFRVGDFYETFGQDAVIASQVLGITLTKRNNGAAASLDLAGFPHHSLDTYLHKLVKAGYRVAICDQLEDPKQAKGIVKRGVTEMLTPGTAINDKLLEHNSNNFLAGIHFADNDQFGLAFLDLSTGEFFVAEGDREYADKLLQSFRPAEVVFQRHQQKKYKEYFGSKVYIYTLDEWIFDENYAQEVLLKHFQTHSLKGFGTEEMHQGITAAGAVIHYLKDTEHPNLQHITSIGSIHKNDFLWMDKFTIRNLELAGGPTDQHTLLKVLDNTVSPMGARLLKRWIIFPLIDLHRINERLNVVENLIKDPELRQTLTQAIKACGDIERLVAKIPTKKINPREVLQLARGLQQVALIKEVCLAQTDPYLKRIGDALNPCPVIAEKIFAEIIEQPPATIAKGGVIQNGILDELDELRTISRDGKAYLTQLQVKEAEQTGISSLKVGFNNVFGYYLEVTNVHKSKVPENWIRKQTLANAERYITPELKEYEEKITGAEEKILQLEQQLYDQLLNQLFEYLAPVQANGNLVALLDCLGCFAHNAVQYHYKKPVVHEEASWNVKEGRHPVIERNLPVGESYIHNDLELNKTEQQIIILTGPNMSGKSALLRQTALITLMAHMGSFVPATEAYIPLTDKIFTRVGASDNLSGGESTFMVEMNETASIINNITDKSLVLLDEIGRGTSTYDGISIAWSIAEYLHQSPHQPKTLFATHYHELNELEEKLNRVKNYHVTNKEIGNKIIFLRKLARGGSTHSFGIHVAKMAGMPPALIQRANEILTQLETKHVTDEQAQPSLKEKIKEVNAPKFQLSIFDAHSETFDEIRKALTDIDVNRLTPVEALLKLQEIKEKIK